MSGGEPQPEEHLPAEAGAARPFWEDAYRDPGSSAFGPPSEEVALPPPADLAPFMRGLFRPGELAAL